MWSGLQEVHCDTVSPDVAATLALVITVRQTVVCLVYRLILALCG